MFESRFTPLAPCRHRPRTRGQLAAGACDDRAIRVAGVWIMPTSLARSSSSDGSAASALTPFGVEAGLAHRAAEDDELFVRLGEVGGDLRRRDRIAANRRSRSDP